MPLPNKKNSKFTPAAVPAKVQTPAPVTPDPTFSAPIAERSEFKGSGKPKTPVAARTITHDDIARRAYDIYASRGYAPGDPVADWHEAERQLRAGL